MTHHAYIDESGTMDHQGVMTVALVVLEGKNSAANLQEQLMTLVRPDYVNLMKRLKKERRTIDAPKLHYIDLNEQLRQAVVQRCAQSNISVYSASHEHADTEKTHAQRFRLYSSLVQIIIKQALIEHNELIVGIGKQGGWHNTKLLLFANYVTLPKHRLAVEFTAMQPMSFSQQSNRGFKLPISMPALFATTTELYPRSMSMSATRSEHGSSCLPNCLKKAKGETCASPSSILCACSTDFPHYGWPRYIATQWAKAYDTRFVTSV